MKLFRILPAIYVLYLGGQFFAMEMRHGDWTEALRTLVVPSLIIGFVVWREWKIARDPEFAARQAVKDASPWTQARLAGAVCLGVFIGAALLLLWLSKLYPHMLDGLTFLGGIILMYAFFLIPIAVAAWRYFSVRRRLSRQP